MTSTSEFWFPPSLAAHQSRSRIVFLSLGQTGRLTLGNLSLWLRSLPTMWSLSFLSWVFLEWGVAPRWECGIIGIAMLAAQFFEWFGIKTECLGVPSLVGGEVSAGEPAELVEFWSWVRRSDGEPAGGEVVVWKGVPVGWGGLERPMEKVFPLFVFTRFWLEAVAWWAIWLRAQRVSCCWFGMGPRGPIGGIVGHDWSWGSFVWWLEAVREPWRGPTHAQSRCRQGRWEWAQAAWVRQWSPLDSSWWEKVCATIQASIHELGLHLVIRWIWDLVAFGDFGREKKKFGVT